MRTKPTFATLVVYDVSSVIYAGNTSKYGSDFVGGSREENTRVKGVPVGGVRRLLQFSLLELKGLASIVYVFDSRTDKRKLFPAYKSQRKLNPEVALQKEMAYEIAQRLGIPCIKVDGYEADDLIAALVRQECNNFSAIKIVTGDADIAANIISSKVSIEGAASIYPSIEVDTYPSLIKSGEVVEYNSVLPFFFFMGKASNNVPAIASEATSHKMYQDFLTWARQSSWQPNQWSSAPVMYEYLLYLLQHGTPEATVQSYLDRMECVYPKAYDAELNVPAITSEDVNTKELKFFARMFGMQRISALYGFDKEFASIPFVPDMDKFLVVYRNMMNSGVIAEQADTTPDISFFVNRSTHFDSNDVGDF